MILFYFVFFWSRDPFQHQKQIKKVLFEMWQIFLLRFVFGYDMTLLTNKRVVIGLNLWLLVWWFVTLVMSEILNGNVRHLKIWWGIWFATKSDRILRWKPSPFKTVFFNSNYTDLPPWTKFFFFLSNFLQEKVSTRVAFKIYLWKWKLNIFLFTLFILLSFFCFS